MKLFLTSAGLTTDLLQNKFVQLLPYSPAETQLAFITTASKPEKDKSFVQKDIDILSRLGVKNIQLIDISQPQANWEKALQEADVIWVEGGNTFYLLDKFRKAGLDKTFASYLKNKLYVGVSAGSIIVTPSIEIASVEPADPNIVNMSDFTGLSLVDFEVSPHTPDIVTLDNVNVYAKKIKRILYAYDDKSALLSVNNVIQIIGDGFREFKYTK